MSTLEWLRHQVSGLELSVLGVWAGLYKKSIIEQYDIRFKTGMKTCEDFYFNLQYFGHIESLMVIDNAGYCYRDNPESVTNNRPLSHADDYQFIFDASRKFLDDNQASNDEYDVFYSRWLRWCIDLIFNWSSQKITSSAIIEKLEGCIFWTQIVKGVNGDCGFLVRLEKYLLMNHNVKLIFMYRRLLELLKKTRGKV